MSTSGCIWGRVAVLPSGRMARVLRVRNGVAIVRRLDDNEEFNILEKHLRNACATSAMVRDEHDGKGNQAPE